MGFCTNFGEWGTYAAIVHVEIGPAPSDSALAYVAMSRDRLADLKGDPGDLAAVLTPFVVDTFNEMLDAWEAAALARPVFRWESDLDVETVEHVFHAFYVIVGWANERYPDAPDDDVQLRRPFRLALTNGFLDALESEGSASAELAEALRESWPDDDLD